MSKRTMPRKKTTERRKLKIELEKLVKDFVRNRDEHICQRCSQRCEGMNCHASHVIPVSRDGRLAFDPLNLKVLCFHDHINWWHKHPAESGPWFIATFPERWEYLQSQMLAHRDMGSITLGWFRDRIAKLKEKGL